MSTQIFSRLSSNSADPSILIAQSGSSITTGANALSNARKALGDTPKATGFFYWEAICWTTTLNALGSNFAIGIAEASSPLNTAVGVDAHSYAYYPGTGEVRNNNAVVSSSANWVSAERTVIQVFGNLNSVSGQLQFGVNGSWLGAFTVAAGTFYVPALTVAGGNAGENNIYVNFGLTGFLFPITSAPA